MTSAPDVGQRHVRVMFEHGLTVSKVGVSAKCNCRRFSEVTEVMSVVGVAVYLHVE